MNFVESLGSKLRHTRETKGYTIDQVAQDTHIATRYIKAVEEEDFAIFTGETHLIRGFLSNYGEYLGIDSKEVFSLYNAMKLQEQPVPLEELLKPQSSFSPRLFITAFCCLLLLGGIAAGLYFFVFVRQKKPSVIVDPERTPTEYTMNTNTLERRFYVEDTVFLSYANEQYTFRLSNLGDAITLEGPTGQIILNLGQEVTLDLNTDGLEELRIMALEFAKNQADAGVVLRFDLDGSLASFNEGTGSNAGGADILANTGLANATLIFSSPVPYPFTLQLSFQAYCMFRWEILAERDRQGRTEQYFQRGNERNLEHIQNGIRIWASNAAAVKAQVIGGGRTVPLELGSAGEVVVVDVRWVKDDNTRYRLVLIRLE
jgi:cytoskeletal protein RodZ